MAAIEGRSSDFGRALREAAGSLFDNPDAITALRLRLVRLAQRDLNEADAEDAAQETLMAVHRSLDRYRGAAQFNTYVFATLRNKTVDIYRQHGREKVLAAEGIRALSDHACADAMHFDCALDPAELLDAKRQAQDFWIALKVCLRAMPKRMRAVFELREVLELDWPVVCSLVNVTGNHGGVLAHRARARIRRRWETR